MLTHPDHSFSINKVCQFMHQPTENHWAVVKRILRYLKGTFGHGLFFIRGSSDQLQVFCDADWAGYPDDRKST